VLIIDAAADIEHAAVERTTAAANLANLTMFCFDIILVLLMSGVTIQVGKSVELPMLRAIAVMHRCAGVDAKSGAAEERRQR
jgi:hypothetical protein